jgi:hypothetical protein
MSVEVCPFCGDHVVRPQGCDLVASVAEDPAAKLAWKWHVRRRAELLEDALGEALGPGLRRDAVIAKVHEVVTLAYEGIDRGVEVGR